MKCSLYVGSLLVAAFLLSPTSWAQRGPSSINVSGGLFAADGKPLTNPSVNFKIEILDKTGTCLLYSENHLAQDLSNTKGGFSLEVGKGSSASNLIDSTSPTAMTSKVYENSGAVGPWAGCTSGATLADGDERLIRVTYDLGSGPVVMSPDVPVAAAAYAIVAQTLQGKRPADFIQVHDDMTNKLNQANVEEAFSSTNWPKLQDLLNGVSSQYMVSNPSAAVGFNGQRITNVGTPSATGDAATKGYSDGYIGGKVADVSTVGPAAGNGHTLIWDQASQKWITGIPNAVDSSKLPLAGGTMLGAIDMGGFNFTNTGHITMAPLKTLTFGTLNNAQETTLISTLIPANAGASWYNSQDKVFKIWDGTAAIAQVWSVNGKTGGAITLNANDLGLGTAALENVGTGAGDVPVLDGTGKIPSALLPTYLTWGDILNGVGKYMDYRPNNTACGNNQVLKWDNTNSQWICGNDNDSFSGSTAGGELTGTYPNPTIAANAISTPKLFTNPGVNRLVATDGSSGATLVPFECTGTQIMQWSGTGWSCQNVSAVIGTGYIADGGSSRGAALSIGTNDNFDLGFRTNNTVKMTLDASGNLGVGTATPARLLHVNGPIRVAAGALPSSPAAGDIAVDSGSSNALKWYNGSAWQTVGTGNGNGDFLRNGSLAMTGALDMGSQNVTNVGTNLTSSAALTIANTGANSLTLSSNGTNATALNLSVAGTNGGITLAPNGTGIVTSSTPVRVTPTALPGSPAAGTIAFDSGSANAMKYYDGSAWVSIGSGTGDFLRNGSLAMTGALQMGSQNITGVGTNITSSAALTIANTGANSLTLSSNGTNSTAVNIAVAGTNGGITLAPNGTGIVTSSTPVRVTPTALPASPTAGMIAFDSGSANALKFYDGAAWQTVGTGTGNGDFMKNGSVAMTGALNMGSQNITSVGTNITSSAALTIANTGANSLTLSSNGTNATALNLSVAGTNGGITLAPNGTGIVTSSTPVRVTPTALPASPVSGTIAFDSGSANAMKYYDGSAWVSIGSGTGDFLRNGSLAMTGDFNAGGNRVLGNSTASANLELESTSNATKGYVLLQKNGGNVGIGTTAPARLLHVNGPMRITPVALPSSPAAGELAFDSGSSNALKFYNGSAWQTVGTGNGNGDFLRNGSLAMTGALDMGSQNITNVGTNLTSSAALTIANTGANSLTLSSNGTNATAVNIAVAGTNGGITLAPNGTGIVTSSTPVRVTPTALPASPAAGTIAFDSGSANAMKYYDGSAWVSIGSGTGDFLRNGSLAMTGALQMGSQNITGVGTNITSSAALTIANTGANSLMLSSNGTNATALNLSVAGTNGGITLAPNGTGIVTSSTPVRVTPTALPASPASGTIAFDSGSANAMKYYDGSAWVSIGSGTGDFLRNGSLAMTGALQMGSQNITGVGTNITSSAALTIANTGANSLTLSSNGTNATAVNIAVAGTNGGITLAPNGTGIVTSSTPVRVTPTALPASPASGTIAFDSGAANAMKYYDGSAWVSIGSGTGDFLKNGSVAMTGALNMGSQNITSVGTNITSSAALTIANTGANSLTLSSNGTNATALNLSVVGTNGGITLTPNGTGIVTSSTPVRVTPTALPASPASGTIAFDSGASNAMKYYDGSAWVSIGSGTGDFLKNGSIAMTGALQMGSQNITGVGTNITSSAALTIANTGANSLMLSSNGTNATALNLSVAGTNGGITLAPNGTGIVTSSTPVRVTPTALPASPAAGMIAFDSGASNALKFYDGAAWQTVGTGTGNGDFMKNGSVAMTGALQMGSQNITGVGTNITSSAALTIANTGANSLTLSSNGTNATALNLSVAGTNGGITLAPNGTGIVTSSTPVRVTPTALPSSPAAGTIAFDSGASNAMKYYDGSAWVAIGSGTGDFLKNGSVAMTGNFNAGGNSILGNTTASANLTLESTSNGTKGYVNIQPNGGNVGIGTPSPTAPLHIEKDTNGYASSFLYNPNTGNAARANFSVSSSGSSLAIETYSSGFTASGAAKTGGAALVSSAVTGLAIVSNHASANLRLYTGGNADANERMRIDASGNVGIGTTTPAAPLDVVGQARAGSFSTKAGGAFFLNNGPFISTAGPNDIAFSTSSFTRMIIDSAGNVGIGTTSPSRLLHVNGAMKLTASALPGTPGTGDVAIDSGDSNKLKWYDGSAWQSAGGSSGGFAGAVNASSTPYTITSSDNGKIFYYSNNANGVINLPSLSGLSNGFSVSIHRQVAKSLTITPSGSDKFPGGVSAIEMQGKNLQSVTLTKMGTLWMLANQTDECTVGQDCWTSDSTGGMKQLYVGIYKGHQYFTTPGGCTNSTTPTCAGGTDTVTKVWSSSATTNVGGGIAGNTASVMGMQDYADGTAVCSTCGALGQSAYLATQFTDTQAAHFCEDMTYAGYSDWYLPSKEELGFLYRNSQTIGGFTYLYSYFSSSEANITTGGSFNFSLGSASTTFSKTSATYVRCVRRF